MTYKGKAFCKHGHLHPSRDSANTCELGHRIQARKQLNLQPLVDELRKAVLRRPEYLQEKHLVFLDDLRESGVTNMYGAGPYVMRHFKISEERADTILAYWMRTFSERHPKGVD